MRNIPVGIQYALAVLLLIVLDEGTSLLGYYLRDIQHHSISAYYAENGTQLYVALKLLKNMIFAVFLLEDVRKRLYNYWRAKANPKQD
jgi:hypothetical protein